MKELTYEEDRISIKNMEDIADKIFDFKRKANIIHQNKYEYTISNDFKSISKITIICPIHGEFLQNRIHHIKGSGCPHCKNVPPGGHKSISTEDFINKIKHKFANLNFDQFVYINNRTKGKIICPIHGIFEKTPKHLLRGQGCPYCSGKTKGSIDNIKNYLNTECLKFDYDVLEDEIYKNNKTHVTINCKKHGVWKVRPDNLINSKQICPKCSKNYSKKEIEIQDFLKENKIEYQTNVKNILDDGTELDIFIPSHNLAIEYNGLYWHSENSGKKNRNYHLNKTLECQKKNIILIHIFEDEWNNPIKKNIWKSIIKNKLFTDAQMAPILR